MYLSGNPLKQNEDTDARRHSFPVSAAKCPMKAVIQRMTPSPNNKKENLH
jgi:hypothetical protein